MKSPLEILFVRPPKNHVSTTTNPTGTLQKPPNQIEMWILRVGWIIFLILMTLEHVIETLKRLIKEILSLWQ